MSERDIESLGVMGWGGWWRWEILPSPPSSSLSPPPKSGCLLVNGFFTIGPQNRDLGALLPGNDSYGRPASFLFSWEDYTSIGLGRFSVNKSNPFDVKKYNPCSVKQSTPL